MRVRGDTGILAAFCRSAQGAPDPPNVIDVVKTMFLCMSGKLTEAVYQLQYNVTAAINVNNCWYRREYEKCLSENLGAGAVGHVTEFDQAVYPKNCSGEQAQSSKCVSDALSELSKYSCLSRVTEGMERTGNSSLSPTERLKEAYCRASVTGYDCVLSVVKYCGVREGPGVVDSISDFTAVRGACTPLLPTTTNPAPVDIGPIGDLFPKSFFTTVDVNAALSPGTSPHPHPVCVSVCLLVLLFCR
ncbi:uncharacterized protein LOC144626582 [Crassostrea virginica]